MGSRDVNRCVLSVCAAMVMLAGCSESQPPISASSAVAQAPAREVAPIFGEIRGAA